MSSIKAHLIEVDEGAGAKVKRLFPTQYIRNFDPFVLFDDFSISPPAGFPDHPHRGFEILTLVLEGSIRHGDSLGNSEVIEALGIQKITIGKGIVHSEMPAGEGITRGIQLWVNLPRAYKGVEPSYLTLSQKEIPVREHDGVREYLIAGEGTKIKFFTPVEYSLLEMKEDKAVQKIYPEERNSVIYPIKGKVEAEGIEVSEGSALLTCRCREIKIRSMSESVVVVVCGKPIGEPIIQKGPFVD